MTAGSRSRRHPGRGRSWTRSRPTTSACPGTRPVPFTRRRQGRDRDRPQRPAGRTLHRETRGGAEATSEGRVQGAKARATAPRDGAAGGAGGAALAHGPRPGRPTTRTTPELPVRRPDLPARQPAAARAARARARQAAPARPLGHDAGAELHLRPPEPRHPAPRPRRDLHRRPGPRRPGLVANAYLEGTYSEVYPTIGRDEAGLRQLFRQFSFPGGIPSHVAPETPGSIHEGGELGYALAHAYGAGVRQPGPRRLLRDRRRRGGDRAARGELALEQVPRTRRRDGAVLPILHLNGYKIANPTVLARIPSDELARCSRATATGRSFVEGDDPAAMHQEMAATLDAALDEIAAIQAAARAAGGRLGAPALADDRAPHAEGLDRPETVDGKRSRGRGARTRCRSPRSGRTPSTASCSSVAAELPPGGAVRRDGALSRSSRAAAGRRPPDERQPARQRRPAAAGPRAAGLPRLRRRRRARRGDDSSEATPRPGRGCATSCASATPQLPPVRPRRDRRRTGSTPCSRRPTRPGSPRRCPVDEHLAPDGRVMEILSEHPCQGWLEGYLLTGRHGLFNCYEAFIHIVDSMFNQHAKWLKVTRDSRGAADRVAELPAVARTSGARTTTASATRTRASSTTWSTRRRRSSASTCRRTRTRCSRSPTTACAAATTST